ncbi:uroporphyrinogen decarboxylase family protein [Tengunoibacter tsumagoiensis]|uniref:Uroporphyrinogen decarboxylase n=1 Tax=Tengunoibacter tsumagoiensis TaxID=2014871 RepID=A0A401ZXL7_9CHLR|nr:uroporphyrinogen decarboxylase family protein [Tengunoibacter tsumagoiensis]GCE11582.1 uroporphyrinogen decarboxylase [Tengunoibacter tsumagoiensis]
MAISMTPRQRVAAALQGLAVDRVPFCFWHHFHPEGSGERLAAATLEFFHQKFDLDIIKIMPDLPYPEPAAQLVEADQVRMLPRLDLETPSFREQLHCIRLLRSQLGEEYPIILTLFSPLTYLLQFMGKQKALAEIRRNPQPIEEGLGTIAANLRQLMDAAISSGASGIFFSCMGATSADLTPDEYLQFGRPYDLEALDGAQTGWLNIVHIHAEPNQVNDEIHFDIFADYPVSAISWSDRLTGPGLSEAHELTDKCLMGGLAERGPLTHGSAVELENEILSAIAQTKGHHLILANGCSIPDDTPEEWLSTARTLVEKLS